MADMQIAIAPKHAARRDLYLRMRIDALTRGECSEEEFLCEALEICETEGLSPWNLLSLIDQRYRQGHLSEPLFHLIKTRISRRAIDDRPDGMTIKLFPAARLPKGDTCMLTEAEAIGARTADRGAAIECGRVLANRYTLESRLGRGGMGEVFKATDALGIPSDEVDDCVAVKVLRGHIGSCPELLARLRREFECTRKLSHPNIVKVYDLDRDDDLAFYTMELLEGEHLRDLIERAGKRPLPRGYAWAIIGAIGAALAHAHSRNVIHGDVSPKNVMITRGGEVRVLDFGSSRVSPRQTPPASEAVDAVAATPPYASCELLEGEQIDPRDDLYALSCLAYELLGGLHPFEGRCATEARDLGLRPKRLPGLNHTQWHAIEQGLSWSRAGRSMPIRQWLADLGLEPAPERLPPMEDADKSKPEVRSSPAPADEVAMAKTAERKMPLAVNVWLSVAALIGIYLLIALHSSRGLSSSAATAINAATAPASAVMVRAEPPPPALTVAASSPNPGPQSVPAKSSRVRDRAPKAAATVAPRSNIWFTADRYAVRPGAHFAEIQLRRLHPANDGRGFVWWTEDSSARAGMDFVGQAKTAYNFSGGAQFATLFVRLIPNAARTQTANFHVCIGNVGAGAAAGDVVCSAILLPVLELNRHAPKV